MEVILFVLFVGIIGGAFAGLTTLVIGWHRRDAIAALASRRRALDPPAINYSSLKVSGVGGLCLVVLCLGIAMALPQVRQTVLAGLALGIIMAVALVLWRRRAPLPSSGAKPGANITLAIEDEDVATERPQDAHTGHRIERHAV